METVLTCPFGSVCEEAKDGKVYRCRLFISMARADADGNMIPGSEYSECSFSLESLHATELKKGVRMLQASIESSRNESVKRQDSLLQIVGEQHAALPSN